MFGDGDSTCSPRDDIDLNELFDPAEIIMGLNLDATQAPSMDDDATPLGQHVVPDVEIISPTRGFCAEAGKLYPSSDLDGKHSPVFLKRYLRSCGYYRRWARYQHIILYQSL